MYRIFRTFRLAGFLAGMSGDDGLKAKDQVIQTDGGPGSSRRDGQGEG
jgi:hypothetical protein